jgi:hypothetical protein
MSMKNLMCTTVSSVCIPQSSKGANDYNWLSKALLWLLVSFFSNIEVLTFKGLSKGKAERARSHHSKHRKVFLGLEDN